MADETKHTPGPWHHWQPIGEEWAVTTTGPRPEMGGAYPHMPIRLADEIDREADARLMASAPDLLAALVRVGCRVARVYANGNTCEERLAVDPDGVDRCHVCAAIAKARGGK